MDKESLKIEYLVFIDTGNAFCADINALTVCYNLMQKFV